MDKDVFVTPSGKTVFQYNFNDLVELVDYVEDAQVNRKVFSGNLSSARVDSDGWYKTKSFGEALELCLSGDDDLTSLFNETNSEFSKIFPYLSQKRNIVNSYYGHRPNVSRYLTSNPRCMYKLERNEPYNVVNIHYNVAAPHYCSAESIFNRGIIIINVIKFLESLGYRVRLDFFELCCVNNEYFYVNVNLKKPEERISPSICYFPMCNPSFLRRILFRVKESTDFKDYYWNDSYGRTLELNELRNAYENILNIDMKNCILVGIPPDMNVYGKDLMADTKNFLECIDVNKYLGENQLNINENTNSFVLRRKR